MAAKCFFFLYLVEKFLLVKFDLGKKNHHGNIIVLISSQSTSRWLK